MARKKKSRQRQKKSGSGTIVAIALACIVLLALISAGGYLFLNTEKQIAIDKNTLCPTIGAVSTTAILLDTTDELAGATKAAVNEKIERTLSELPRFSRLAIYRTDENGLDEDVFAEVCNPGRLDQRGALEQGGLTANPEKIRRRHEEFTAQISAGLNEIFTSEFDAQQSPLLGALQKLSLKLPKPVGNKISGAQKNKIIFVTDFLEHTEDFSIYRSGLDLEAFRTSRATEKYGRKYTDTDLEFWFVRRNIDGFSTKELQIFWWNLFATEFASAPLRASVLDGEL